MSITITTQPKATVILEVSRQIAEQLLEKQKKGQDVEGDLLRRVEAAATAEGLHSGMTFRELHAPLQDDFEKSGMNEEELGDLIDRAVDRARVKSRKL